jgi:K+-transporting ATPase ATPase B chain
MDKTAEKGQSAPDTAQPLQEVPVSALPRAPRRLKPKGLFEKETTLTALKQAFIMLRPEVQWKNPVMFVVGVGAFLTLLYIIQMALRKGVSEVPISYFI